MHSDSIKTLAGGVRTTSRWYIKKLARALVAKTSRAVAVTFLGSKPGDQCVRVLTYHRFGDAERDPFCVAPVDFDAQMGLLSAEGRAVSLQQVEQFLNGTGTVPANACLVTIDDGMRSTLTQALPVLEKYGVPAVAFVSSKLVGLDMPDLPEPYLNEDELRALSRSKNMTIGSHAHTHRSMAELSAGDMQAEAITSRRLLSDYVDSDVNSFAYPFGMQRDFTDKTDTLLQRSGYSIAFNSMHGAIRKGMHPISLPRVKIEGGESLRMFESISNGAMDMWRIVDDNLWRLQRTRREII